MVYKFFFIAILSVFLSNPEKEVSLIVKHKNLATKNAETIISKPIVKLNLIEENSENVPSLESFRIAYEGYENLKNQNKLENNILTIIDFSLSSNKKRLWVIDMESNVVLFHSLVAHGMNSGEEFATNFSNKSESHKSSLGFYLTGEIYQGKHGSSLKLDGIEKGINDNARERAIVIHGADYVSENFIKNNGRLGRSQGCPALPINITNNVISKIKNKSVLFIYHPSKKSAFSQGGIS
jgi:hypothetical protein